MLYKDFKGLKLSALGMGAMRLPTIGKGADARPDEEQSREIIDYAYQNGVNYFDTAFMYHGGESEKALGKILSAYPRESFYLADKFFYQSMTEGMTVKAFFEVQLERCQVDYFDFYLVHSVSDENIEDYLALDKTQDMMAYLESERKAGRIRHLGFSCHSSTENMLRFLEIYPFEFVMVQCNYLDWTFQDAKSKYDALRERGTPMWAMEPVRGGALATHGAAADARLHSKRPDESVAAWAFRYLQTLDNVGMILSGMSSMAQVQDNVKTLSAHLPLDTEELALLQTILDERLPLIPCTNCRYCYECPQELDIPKLLSIANEHTIDAKAARWSIDGISEEQQPGNCTACGLCSKVCPQGLDVPALLAGLDAVVQTARH